MTIPNVRQTKFLLAVFILIIATLAMLASLVMYYTGGSSSPFVTFDSWWQVGLFLLGIYSTADIVSTHLQQGKQVPPENQTA